MMTPLPCSRMIGRTALVVRNGAIIFCIKKYFPREAYRHVIPRNDPQPTSRFHKRRNVTATRTTITICNDVLFDCKFVSMALQHFSSTIGVAK